MQVKSLSAQSTPPIEIASVGAGLCIAVVAALGHATGTPLILGSFGATVMILFAFSASPFAKPRAVIGGHVLSSFVGLACLRLLGPDAWAMGLAVALAIAAMLATRTAHPPAASNVLIIYLSQPGWAFIVMPTLAGALAVLSIALATSYLQSIAQRRKARTIDDQSKNRPPLRVFIRQPYTETGDAECRVVSEVLELLRSMDGNPHQMEFLTGTKAESGSTFRETFTKSTGIPFTPKAFRRHRLVLLDQADVVINIRTAISESTAFELAYHIYQGTQAPVLMLVWSKSPIKTTLLKELDEIADVTYLEFDHASDIAGLLKTFISRVTTANENGAAQVKLKRNVFLSYWVSMLSMSNETLNRKS
jgi:hypothetical protein